MNATSPITTHILDLTTGRPASGVAVTLLLMGSGERPSPIGSGTTDADGRLRNLVPADHSLTAGTYRLRFATGGYYQRQAIRSFHPEVVIDFAVDEPDGHYHVPLLLSPFGYSTYRGS